MARPYKPGSSLYFHHAYAAASNRGEFFFMAQARNFNSNLSGRLQDRHPRVAEHLIAVDC
jgi:hypothetical protein